MEPAAPSPPALHPSSHAAVVTASAQRSAFVPTLLMALSMVGWLAFQGVQLARERVQLGELQTSLGAQAEAATKMRASLDTVATATAKLAADGNESARVIVEELRKRGVTINPHGSPKPP